MPTPPIPNSHCVPGAARDLLRARAEFLQEIRAFFQGLDFLEVETPVLIPRADPSPHLESFHTLYRHPHTGQEERYFLRTSPEFAMKRMVAHGYPRIFQIGKFFRNGEVSAQHNPEFTGLEWYAVGEDYRYLMDQTEAMCLALWPSGRLEYQGTTLDLSPPWERLSVHQAVARYAGLQLPVAATRQDLADACRCRQLTVDDDDAWDDLFFKLFLTYVEPHLGQKRPLFLYDYPIQMAALSRAKAGQPALAERVELYIAGLELANGYSELTDPDIQRSRWEEDAAFRRQRQDPLPYPVDEGLLEALQWGMPPTAGIAVGLDRLLMLQRNAATLQDVLPFPF